MIIACDLGSNTLRIVQIDSISKVRIKEYEKSVRTAQNLYETEIISCAMRIAKNSKEIRTYNE